jgi:hypothetical protein
MWNENEYNGNYPLSNDGVQPHIRLIRNKLDKLPYIIKSDKKLHFRLNPYDDEIDTFPLLIKHLGRITPELRQHKYNLYTLKYDINLKCQADYSHFLNDNINYINYENNKYNIFYNYIDSLIPVILYKNNIEDYSIPGCIYIKYENNIPDWLDSNYIVLMININREYIYKIKEELEKRDIISIGYNYNTIINNIYKPIYNTDKIYCIGIMYGIPFGIIEINYNYSLNNYPDITYTQKKEIIKYTIDYYNSINSNGYMVLYYCIIDENISIIGHDLTPNIANNSLFSISAESIGLSFDKLVINLFKNGYNNANKPHIWI